MKTIKLVTSTLVVLMLITSCEKDKKPEEIPSLNVTAERQNVKTYETVSLISHVNLASTYRGTFGAQPVELLKTSDTTLSFYVPDVPAGETTLKFELGHITFGVTQTTAGNPDNFLADLTKDFEAQVGLLYATAPNEVAEVNALKGYRQEVIELFNSLSDEEKRQTMLFYEANKEVVQLMSNIAVARPVDPLHGPTALAQMSGPHLQQARGLSAAANEHGCPATDFQSYYGCLAGNLGREGANIIVGTTKVLVMFGLAEITASLAPATFGISAVGTTLAAGVAGYLLATQICPAIRRFGKSVVPFLKANWIFASTLFETVVEEFPSEVNVNLNLKPKFRAVTPNDTEVNTGTAYFIGAMATLKGYWDKISALVGSFPSYQNSEESTTLETNEVSISNISNPNVKYLGNEGQSVMFKSLSGEVETFTYDISVSKEGFLEQETLSGKVIAADSLEIYKAACVGMWTIDEYVLGKLASKWTLELFPDGRGIYRKSGSSGQRDIHWYIDQNHDGYRYKENILYAGPWSYLERSSVIHKELLTYPVTSFSMHYIGTTVTYIKD